LPVILLQTKIQAQRERVFDLSRSLAIHIASTSKTNEKVISAKKTGLLELDEEVTWRAKHLGIYQNLTSKITSLNYPNAFVDEMQKGIFKSFTHKHIFKKISARETLMIDEFNYESPLGFLGKLADLLFLKKYMERFLKERNQVIKEVAESGEWENYINDSKGLTGF
tara:strand:- start:37766 stop:38266 length:501 start_codon:yes stop_codon:yes gene_type:complete